MTLIQLPATDRARRAYLELRRYGFKPAYATEVVNFLERMKQHLVRWVTVQRVLQLAPEAAEKWLKEKGYV